MSQERFEEKESEQGRQNRKKRDDHHDDADAPLLLIIGVWASVNAILLATRGG
jgi:hypothetical protein